MPADLYATDFPHGTPLGYDLGCRGKMASSCPAALEHGLSCFTAWQKNAGDPIVADLYSGGASVADVAAYLNPAPAPAAPAPAAPEKPAAKTKPKRAVAPKPSTADEVIAAARAVAPRTRAEEIRAWARDRGYDVPTAGRIPRHIIEHYEAAQEPAEAPASPTVPAPTPSPASASEEPVVTPSEADWIGAAARAHDVDERTVAEQAATTIAGVRADVSTVVAAAKSANDPAKGERPDYGTMMETQAVRRARDIAVRLEQELAEAERRESEAVKRAIVAERAVEVLLERWDAANATIARLHKENDEHRASVGILGDLLEAGFRVPAHAARVPDPEPSRWQRFLSFLGMAD